ncbi:MAG: hypothetical protein HUU50_01750 [Candidatus Brocadiae bacterium]|nr:hypothetical protein [Candidatus Brocadiia bacterium]
MRKILFSLFLSLLCIVQAQDTTKKIPQEAPKNSVILVYSQDSGHTWQALDQSEAARNLISKVFHSYFVDPTKPIRKLSPEEQKNYLCYVNSHLKNAPLEKQGSQVGNLHAQLLFQKIFYNLKVVVETEEPLSGIKLAYPQPFPDNNQKFPWANLLEKTTMTKMESNLQVTWRYVALWENILISSQDTKIPYYLHFESGKSPEQREIVLPIKQEEKGSTELTLSPKNFLVPNILVNTGSHGNKEGEILGFLLQEKNKQLYDLLANVQWKGISLKEQWDKKDFLCNHFGIPEFNIKSADNVVDPTKMSGPAEHFLAFETQLKPYHDLAKEVDDLGFSFKGNTILLDYNPDNMGMLVSLPNLESDQKANCWVMYPSHSQRWLEIPHELKKGKYYFAQIFRPRGNKYNIAIETPRSKKVYIQVPIGIPVEELPQYSKEAKDWSVPWKNNFAE